jgi:hypothetical protein
MKKFFIILLAIIAITCAVKSVKAAQKWYEVTINYAGVSTTSQDIVYINVTSANQSWSGAKWFLVSGKESKSALAIALTAWSIGSTVFVTLDDTNLNDWAPVYGIFTAPMQ